MYVWRVQQIIFIILTVTQNKVRWYYINLNSINNYDKILIIYKLLSYESIELIIIIVICFHCIYNIGSIVKDIINYART